MRTLQSWNEIIGFSEVRTLVLYKALAAEFVGTLMLVFTGCATAVYLGNQPINVAFAFGLIVGCIIQAFGDASGGHVNPAVTLGFMVTGYTSLTRGLAYMVAQITGAITGSAILYSMVPNSHLFSQELGIVLKNPDMTSAQAFGMEVVLTFTLIFMILAFSDERRSDINGSAPIAVGLTVTALLLCGANMSGAGINPARCFGPLVIVGGNSWHYHWVYWVGPLGGAAMAGAIYKYIFRATKVTPAENVTDSRAYIIPSSRY